MIRLCTDVHVGICDLFDREGDDVSYSPQRTRRREKSKKKSFTNAYWRHRDQLF